MPHFILRRERCKQCGICSLVCPAKILKGEEGAFPSQRPNTDGRCIACGHCTAFCPHRACDIDVLPPDLYRPVERKLLPSPEAVAALCKSRRSIRQYKENPVPRELLASILETAGHAPTAKNQRSLRFACLGRGALSTLGDLMAERLEKPEATALIVEAKGLALAWRRGMDPIFRGAPQAVFVIGPNGHWDGVDAVIAATYLEVAALPHGIGCCWAGYAMSLLRESAAMRAVVGLREGEAVHAVQMIGFIRLRPTGIPAREPLNCTWVE